MSGERGQSSVEAVVMVPVCALVASVLVSAGACAQQRIRVADAAAQAAVAYELGGDAQVAARHAIGGAAGADASVRITGDGTLTVAAPLQVGGPLADLFPARVTSRVHVSSGGEA